MLSLDGAAQLEEITSAVDPEETLMGGGGGAAGHPASLASSLKAESVPPAKAAPIALPTYWKV